MNGDYAIRREPVSAAESALWAWLALGVLALVLAPALREIDPLFGWLPYWLVVAPSIDLALLHRGRLWSMACGFLVRARHRRRPARQARRLRHRRAARLPFAAAVSRKARPRMVVL